MLWNFIVIYHNLVGWEGNIYMNNCAQCKLHVHDITENKNSLWVLKKWTWDSVVYGSYYCLNFMTFGYMVSLFWVKIKNDDSNVWNTIIMKCV